MTQEHARVVILDFGSQFTQLIARRIREAHVYCEIHPFTVAADAAAWERFCEKPFSALILSGGPSSVYEPGAPQVVDALFKCGRPVLGVCYGMQLMMHALGGTVEASTHREYGHAIVTKRPALSSRLLGRIAESDTQVWMSHGDKVTAVAPGFSVVASTQDCPAAVVEDSARQLFGLQFHPEVAHTERGSDLLQAFLFDIAKIEPNWTANNFVRETVDRVAADVKGHAICGLSGGVDSSVAATLVARAIGRRLTCVFVNNGLLRRNEAEDVRAMFATHIAGPHELRLVYVDAAERFLSALKGVTDPEQKRKIIGRIFVEVFDEEAKKLTASGIEYTHLVQGTLYPDVIESVSAKGPSATIKTHHNVGGLPKDMAFRLCEPLRELFKDEVRAVGAELGLPHDVLWRHPFPGPGLAIRCLGEVTEEKLALLRAADAIFVQELKSTGLYAETWQAFVVILPVRTVGVMGDGRTYDHVVALRAVTSRDGMTADWARLPFEFLARVSSRIANEVKGINRVVYDISSKPPSTIEWE